jgi:hypothetical protein
MQSHHITRGDRGLAPPASAPRRSAVREARADALIEDLRYQGGSYTFGGLCQIRAWRRNPWGWTASTLEQAVDDLAARGEVRLVPRHGDVVIQVVTSAEVGAGE